MTHTQRKVTEKYFLFSIDDKGVDVRESVVTNKFVHEMQTSKTREIPIAGKEMVSTWANERCVGEKR